MSSEGASNSVQTVRAGALRHADLSTTNLAARAACCLCAASEVTEIKLAVSALKDALEGVRSNTDATRSSMLRVNLKEARDILARRLQETAPGIAPAGTSTDASLSAATREASVLLDEVTAQFFPSSVQAV